MKFDGYISLSQAAIYAGVVPNTIHRAASEGKLRWERISGHKATKPEWVTEWRQQLSERKIKREWVGYSCMFDVDQWQRLKELTEAKNMTTAAIIRDAVARYIETEGKENG